VILPIYSWEISTCVTGILPEQTISKISALNVLWLFYAVYDDVACIATDSVNS